MLKRAEKKFTDTKNVLTSGTHIKNIKDKVDNGNTV